MTNMILNTDSYKLSHFAQYPEGTTHVSSYIESRGGAYDFTLFFGLQMFLDNLRAPTVAEVMEAYEIASAHGVPFNLQGWLDLANLGFLPLHIQAVKEGTVLPTHNVLVQVVNTDPKFAWLTSFIETAMLRAIWYPTTVATRSKFIKNIIATHLSETSDNPEAINFMLHDFGGRGVSSEESAGIGGAAHLVNFMGTDTMSALVYARKYYGASMAAFSVPAAEHSTITSWGRDKEALAVGNMIDKFAKPGSIVSVVGDSYDIYNFTSKIVGTHFKDVIEQSGARFVVRPDSGDPTKVPVEIVEILAEKFGTTTNSKGYKVLPNCVRVLQGDGINEQSIDAILTSLNKRGFSAENMVFGMGGELLQTPNRDTLKFAMKASAVKSTSIEGGMWRDVFKDPVTDSGKKSKRGRLGLVKREGVYMTVPEVEANGSNLLETVFLNGEVKRLQKFEDIRAMSNQ